MKIIYYFAGLVAMAFLCTGCWPEHITSSPAAWGYVLDAKTHEPIVGAKAQMSYTWRAYWSDLNPPQLSDVLTNVLRHQSLLNSDGVAVPAGSLPWYPCSSWMTCCRTRFRSAPSRTST